MEPSKSPKDVLGLGKHIVNELGMQDEVDTLGRWMAHHVAELINKAENGKTIAERNKAKLITVEVILKIWEHRRCLPHNTYPLAKYDDLLKVVDRLKIDNNPWKHFAHTFRDKADNIASAMFDDFVRLILTLLFMKRPHLLEKQEIDPVVIETLDEEEQQIISTIYEWVALFPTKEGQDKSVKNGKQKKKLPTLNLSKNATELIKDLRRLLNMLEDELKIEQEAPVKN